MLRGCSEGRIRPDLPRCMRLDTNTEGVAKTQLREGSVIAHELPESRSDDPYSGVLHDIGQWNHTASKLSPERPSRLLRIVLLSASMAEDALERWFITECILPSNLHLHRCRPRGERQALRQQPPHCCSNISLGPARQAQLGLNTQPRVQKT
ncbi:hypothetical protein FGIG_11131 [Fasciola gigantica]|uniref:Uncharacterized protein n=1 Tax=Fasciola gigantica TaxID=46835 RepID=A0A504YG12_FASGI|nr:hypothetical protein FGIG_11131 [Fasciola gigantica]